MQVKHHRRHGVRLAGASACTLDIKSGHKGHDSGVREGGDNRPQGGHAGVDSDLVGAPPKFFWWGGLCHASKGIHEVLELMASSCGDSGRRAKFSCDRVAQECGCGMGRDDARFGSGAGRLVLKNGAAGFGQCELSRICFVSQQFQAALGGRTNKIVQNKNGNFVFP